MRLTDAPVAKEMKERRVGVTEKRDGEENNVKKKEMKGRYSRRTQNKASERDPLHYQRSVSKNTGQPSKDASLSGAQDLVGTHRPWKERDRRENIPPPLRFDQRGKLGFETRKRRL